MIYITIALICLIGGGVAGVLYGYEKASLDSEKHYRWWTSQKDVSEYWKAQYDNLKNQTQCENQKPGSSEMSTEPTKL